MTRQRFTLAMCEGCIVRFFNGAHLVGTFKGDIDGLAEAMTHAPSTQRITTIEITNNECCFCGAWRVFNNGRFVRIK